MKFYNLKVISERKSQHKGTDFILNRDDLIKYSRKQLKNTQEVKFHNGAEDDDERERERTHNS